MAYMVSISTTCQAFDGACKRPRTHRVYSTINESKGEYCKRHAEKRLAEVQATEDRHCAAPSPAETMRAHLDTFGKD